ncbi:hypothetical protein MSG28_007475 [Choristoneura fumiferana]|uniref:Uncharacterized protein n=1 Tax=Choristoneura fumiferana TaxID=7141 RepID=A0ACC0JXG0_CHOFU|nr:hypothetical protein MSG28_007475 [Choristoneura fumiferana]
MSMRAYEEGTEELQQTGPHRERKRQISPAPCVRDGEVREFVRTAQEQAVPHAAPHDQAPRAPAPSSLTNTQPFTQYIKTLIRIVRNDEITDQICLACRKKLKDLYDFKLLIQSSNTALNQKYSSHIKRINFNNITEIKLEFDVSQAPKDDKHFIKEFDDEKINLLGLEDSICYSNTTIKKLVSYTTNAEIKQPMSVMDFLNTIKEDPDENYNDPPSKP